MPVGRFFVVILVSGSVACGGGGAANRQSDTYLDPSGGGEHCAFTIADQCVNLWVTNRAAPRITVVDQSVYFSDLSHDISHVDNESGVVETLAHVDRAYGIVADATDLYVQVMSVSGQSNAGVVRLPKAGGEPHDVLQGLDETPAIAVSDGFLFDADRIPGIIRRTPTAGGTTEPMVTAAEQVLGIAAADGELYWHEWGSSPDTDRLMRLDFGRNSQVGEPVSTGDVGAPVLAGGVAYWINDLSGNVWRAAQHGGTPELVFTTVADTVHRGVGLAVGGGYVYVLTSDRRIVRASIGSWQVEELLPHHDLLGGLAADDHYFYFELDDVGIFRVAHQAQ